jgi:hypothetical protein
MLDRERIGLGLVTVGTQGLVLVAKWIVMVINGNVVRQIFIVH